MKPQPKTQKTAQGHEIPVPKKADVFRDLAKVVNPKPKSRALIAGRSRKKG